MILTQPACHGLRRNVAEIRVGLEILSTKTLRIADLTA
jgi:hypothetical protein